LRSIALVAVVLVGVFLSPPGAQALGCPPLPPRVHRALEVPRDPRGAGGEIGTGGEGRVLGGLTPHHDLAGELMVRFYEELRRWALRPRRILLIAPDHHRAGRGAVTFCGAPWETDRGRVPADEEGVAMLEKHGVARRDDALFPREHGITVHLPLLATFFPGVPVLPLVVRSSVSDLELLALRKVLSPLMDSGLVILSMDLSHGKSSAEALEEDRRTLPVLSELRWKELRGLDLDCPRGGALFLALLEERGARRGVVRDHATAASFGEPPEAPGTSYATVLFF